MGGGRAEAWKGPLTRIAKVMRRMQQILVGFVGSVGMGQIQWPEGIRGKGFGSIISTSVPVGI